VNDLVRELQELRAERDEPSLRDLAHLTGINRQSLSEALTGKRLPSWATVEKLVVALSGDLGKFRSLWEYQKMGYRSGGANFVSTEQEEVSCFISYSHIDDEKMAFADKLKSDLEYYAMANRGRKLTVFLDKESIKWGDEWQTSIRQSVLGATAFLPIVTFSYFQSSWCREELLLYYQNARSVGVTELILPIVVFGHSALSSNSDDEVARIISERQYKDLQSAFLEGPGSNEWRRALLDVANNLVDVVDSAERRLAPLETFRSD
jgi:DNA-binding XRE family transcriptional regulator